MLVFAKIFLSNGKDIKTELIRWFIRFMTLSDLYPDNIGKYKFKSINKFISNIDIEKYSDREYYK